MGPDSPDRVRAYVDGFNLYYGLRSKHLKRLYWLDVAELARRLLKTGQQLAGVKYFTARISGGRPSDPPQPALRRDQSRKRQSDYLDALATNDDLEVFEGHFLEMPITCSSCGREWTKAEEKMTDVQIATELLVDAFEDRFDTARLVSGDSDPVPPIRAIRRLFPRKRIVVAFPPGRHSGQLHQDAQACFTIGKAVLKKSQLPDTVQAGPGVTLRRPEAWR